MQIKNIILFKRIFKALIAGIIVILSNQVAYSYRFVTDFRYELDWREKYIPEIEARDTVFGNLLAESFAVWLKDQTCPVSVFVDDFKVSKDSISFSAYYRCRPILSSCLNSDKVVRLRVDSVDIFIDNPPESLFKITPNPPLRLRYNSNDMSGLYLDETNSFNVKGIPHDFKVEIWDGTITRYRAKNAKSCKQRARLLYSDELRQNWHTYEFQEVKCLDSFLKIYLSQYIDFCNSDPILKENYCILLDIPDSSQEFESIIKGYRVSKKLEAFDFFEDGTVTGVWTLNGVDIFVTDHSNQLFVPYEKNQTRLFEIVTHVPDQSFNRFLITSGQLFVPYDNSFLRRYDSE